MSAYFVFNYTVKDPEKYAQYREVVGPTLGQYGGVPLVASADPTAIEGEPQPMLIVLKFESRQAAETWYNSEEYSAIKHLRIEASTDEGWCAIADEFSPA